MDATLLSIICFIIGVVIGFSLNHFVVRSAKGGRRARQELENLRADVRSYQSRVNNHLTRTADLLSRIQASSQEAQELLIAGVQSLGREYGKPDVLQTSNPYLYVEGAESVVNLETRPSPEQTIQPPKDYA
jgi:uncharacterized membrane-anchored protein YhcB (DUF1043 family)